MGERRQRGRARGAASLLGAGAIALWVGCAGSDPASGDTGAAFATAEPAVELARAKALAGAERHAEAAALYLRLIELTRDAERAEALLGAAESLIGVERFWPAHLQLERLLQEHPDTPLLSRAIRREYEVGVAFIEEKAKRPLLGTDTTDPALGAEILTGLADAFQQNYFDYALFLVGEHHYQGERWRRAADHYLRVQQEFPESVWVGATMIKRAECQLQLNRGYAYDDTTVRRAERLLQEYLRRFPQGDRGAEARAGLSRIAGMRAQLYLDNARYYLRNEGKPRAALIYLEAIAREAPRTEQAGRVTDLLERVSAEAEDDGDMATAALAREVARELTRLRAAPPPDDEFPATPAAPIPLEGEG
jgi:tetratricopeptide (TPR) repeat protein